MDRILEAHALAEVAERAYRAHELEAATAFARSAWRTVELDDRPAAVEAFVKASRTESWAWHHLDVLDRAELAAARAVGHARRLAPGSNLLAWSLIRQLEVWGVAGKTEATLAGCLRLAADLEDVSWGRELAFVGRYGALGAATKLRAWNAAEAAEREAERLLAALGQSPYERVLRGSQALHAMQRGRTDDAHELLIEAHRLSAARDADLFPLAHLHFLDGQPDEGAELLVQAIARARRHRHKQSIRAALSYMKGDVPEEILRSVCPPAPSGEIIVRLNLN